jgi:hypothetical protein
MTVTNHEISRGSRRIVVRDRFGPLEFVGETVADLSWTYGEARERRHRRWTDLTLYRVDQSEWRYVVHIVGRSMVYHTPKSPCGRGVGTQVGLLAQDDARYQALVACDRPGCAPMELDDLDDSALVAVEEDLHNLERFRDATGVVEYIYKKSEGQQSGLSMKLLQTASRLDKDIEEAMMKMRRL